MDLGIKGKVTLIMASSTGLGKAIARRFLMEGAIVMMASRNEDKLLRTVEELSDEIGVTPYYKVCDIAQPGQIKALVRTAAETLGPISILVNNAGGPPAGTFESFDDEAWQKAFELNLLSYVRTIREVLPFMKVQKWGRIVNSTSSSVKQVIENLILSNTFRLGVIGLTKTLSQELAPYNILVNAIGPGRFDTQRIRQLDQALAAKRGISVEEVNREALAQIPLGRYGDPDEYGRLAVFLCSEANSYITGQTILADGGMVKAVL
ncbi:MULTISPECIES: SDR family oxidoreductase [Aminobacterium]|jgi:3-oxoacyl-[acyl-carrier protein] reductase|uniref:SDR family oxidoreductase n=1 Tax=Aminobacterium TaxID=81466 RepID=UPI0004666B0F|nr:MULTISPECIES: SDR family oxidoreductase [Aminobacterium]